MQHVPRGETLVQAVPEWGWGQEGRGKEEQVKGGVQGRLLGGQDSAVSRSLGEGLEELAQRWQSTAVTVNRQPSVR